MYGVCWSVCRRWWWRSTELPPAQEMFLHLTMTREVCRWLCLMLLLYTRPTLAEGLLPRHGATASSPPHYPQRQSLLSMMIQCVPKLVCEWVTSKLRGLCDPSASSIPPIHTCFPSHFPNDYESLSIFDIPLWQMTSLACFDGEKWKGE